MVYRSLFDRINVNCGALKSLQAYKGTLEGVLDELGESISDPSSSQSQTAVLLLHPPRIIRAAIDYKVNNPKREYAEDIVRDSIDLGIEIYKGARDKTRISRLRDKIIATGNSQVLTEKLIQPDDSVTWEASSPSRSRRTAQELLEKTDVNNVLFIALAHGGTAAGIDTYLRYCEISGSTNSAFYAVRFSLHKLEDTLPQLSEREIEYLKKQAQKRQVVLFDEDTSSGKTMKTAESFFQSLFPKVRIITATNLGMKKELMDAGKLSHKELEIINGIGSWKEEHKIIKEIFYKKPLNKIITSPYLMDNILIEKKKPVQFQY